MMVLLDTSVIIDAINKRRNRSELLSRLLEQGHAFACSTITVAEVYTGMRPEEEEVTESIIQGLECIELSSELAQSAGRLKYSWARRGQTLSLPDAIIAAVALAFGLTLATDNRSDFPMFAPERFLNLSLGQSQ